jgi:hypothetical protein
MSFCIFCGVEKGEGRFCPGCGGTENQKAPDVSVPQPGSWAVAGSAQSQTSSNHGGVQNNSSLVKPSLGGAITLLVVGLIGAISPFLPYITAGGESASGWQSKKFLTESGKFSAGPLIVLLSSIVAAVIAAVIMSNQKSGKATNKAGAGSACIVSGAAAALGAGGTYSALDQIFKDAGMTVSQGIGLGLGASCGIAIIIIGIVIFAKESVTQGIR